MRERDFPRVFPAALVLPLVLVGVLAIGTRTASSTGTAGRGPGDRTADAVLGQPGFNSNTCHNGGISATTLCLSNDATIDLSTGRMYVSDDLNLRILGYSSGPGFTNGMAADIVIGQETFDTDEPCHGQADPVTVCRTGEIQLDVAGNLYVTDRQNKRVLEFDDPATTDVVADRVFGQPDMFTKQCNLGADGLCGPRGLAFDAAGNLYVSDQGNHRIMVYFDPLNDQVADAVIGAPDFDTKIGCLIPPSASDMCEPRGIDVDANGTLWVADAFNHRVLAFLSPLTTDGVADLVLGQPDFASNICNNGGVSAASLCQTRDAAVTAAGTVYVADMYNSRVLAYFDPFGTDTVADRFFGQSSFRGRACNSGGVPTAKTLCRPGGVELDQCGNLYVGDRYNHRLLRYDTPLP